MPKDAGQPQDSPLVRQAVSRAGEGDRDAMHFLYVRYAAELNREVDGLLHDGDESDAIVQGVFAGLETSIAGYEGASFEAWIRRQAGNAALEHLHGKSDAPRDEAEAIDDTVGHSQGGIERAQELHDALEELPEDQREVLVLRHVLGLSPPEIADTLGKNESSIHGIHDEGRSRLRSSLRRRGVATGAPL